MTRTAKIILFSVLGLGAIIGTYAIIKRKGGISRPKKDEDKKDTTTPTTPTKTDWTKVKQTYPIKYGSKGEGVAIIQNWINLIIQEGIRTNFAKTTNFPKDGKKPATIEVDGVWGGDTKYAIKTYKPEGITNTMYEADVMKIKYRIDNFQKLTTSTNTPNVPNFNILN